MAKAQGLEASKGAARFKLEELRERKKTPAPVYSGVCAAKNWGPGKEVTEAEYEAAVRAFSGAPMGRKVE